MTKCNVTKNGVTCDVDTAQGAAHAQPHTGIKNWFGYSMRMKWYSTDLVPVIPKRPLPGIRARSDQGVLDVVVPTAPTFTAAGMQLGTRYTASGSWGRPSGWVPRSGFTDVEIENDSLIMNGAGIVRVHLMGDVSPGFGATMNKRLVKNGQVVQTWSSSATVESDSTVDVAVVAGDALWPEFNSASGFGASYVEANANTYLYTEVL